MKKWLVKLVFRLLICPSLAAVSFFAGGMVMAMPYDEISGQGQPLCLADNRKLSKNTSHYISMPDGVKIAADVWVPTACQGGSFPAIVTFTRYWRAADRDGTEKQDKFLKYFIDAGFAIVRVDVRGTGASYGARATEFSVAEVNDYRHIVDWIASQSWSNERVASYGVSYSGNTAELALIDPSSALKAAVPRFTDYDWYSSILFPGGLQNRIIGDVWAAGVAALDSNDASVYGLSDQGKKVIKGVKPVEGNYTALEEAVGQHDQNPKFASAVDQVVMREDLAVAMSLDDGFDALVSPYYFQDKIAKNAIPAFHWSSWNDAGTADGVITRFATGKVKGRFLIGAWSHGAEHDADPLAPVDARPNPGVKDQYKMIELFLKTALDADGQWDAPRVLEYYTMGEGVWKSTTVWPPEGTRKKRLYLGPDFSLDLLRSSENSGEDSFTVDFQAGTGKTSRWMTQIGGGDVIYPEGNSEIAGEVIYTSSPVQRDVEITGHVEVSTFVKSSDGKGAVYAYLELVAPEGTVHMVTEGQIRLIHNVSENPPSDNWVAKPYHSFSRQDERLLLPNEVVPVRFVMLPTSIRVPKGYMLRVRIRGHDVDAFDAMDKSVKRIITIHRNNTHASYISFPIIGDGPFVGAVFHD